PLDRADDRRLLVEGRLGLFSSLRQRRPPPPGERARLVQLDDKFLQACRLASTILLEGCHSPGIRLAGSDKARGQRGSTILCPSSGVPLCSELGDVHLRRL